jgi:IS30 family transposase
LDYLSIDYSPEQAAGRAKIEGREIVSIENFYQYVWISKRKEGTINKCLRNQGKNYKKGGHLKDKRGLSVDRTDIDQRPAIVEKKDQIGDLKIDLVIGKNHKGALIIINDRATALLYMDKVESKEARVIQAKTIELLQDWKPILKTITSDNRKKFANHKAIAHELEINFYFAKPHHSWERGSNENLNGLFRQYFPKKNDFRLIEKSEIERVINILNNRRQRPTA